MALDFSGIREQADSGARKVFFSLSLKAWLLVALFVFCFLLIVFFQLQGLVVSLLLILAFILLLIFLKPKPSLQQQMDLIVQQSKEAEKRFLKHLIDEHTFSQIRLENEKKLIGIEAALKREQNPQSLLDLESSELDVRKRHKLKELLLEKDQAVLELEIAKQRYYKHRLDEKFFQEISSEKQKRLVELDTLISELYKLEAKEIMQDTERRLKQAGVKQDSEGVDETMQPSRRRRLKRH